MKNIHIRHLISLLLCIVLVFCLAACGGSTPTSKPSSGQASKPVSEPAASGSENTEKPPVDDGKTYELVVNLTQAAEAPHTKMVKEECAKMEEASNGRLKFSIFDSGTLISIQDTFKGVQDHLCDITFMPTSFAFDYAPINARLLVLPFMGYQSGEGAFEIFNQLREEFPEIDQEFVDYGIVPLGGWFSNPTNLYMTNPNASIDSVEDLKGMKIGVADKYLTSFLSKVGAAPVFVTNADMYTSMDGGVVDGIIQHGALMQVTGCLDIIKSEVCFGTQGINRSFAGFFMNKDSYDALPGDLQQILVEGWQTVCTRGVEIDAMQAANVIDILDKQGCKVIELTEEQIADFAAQGAEIQQGCIDELEAKGISAQKIFDRIQELNTAK